MRNFVLSLAVALSIILPAFAVGSPVSVVEEASAASPYCSVWINSPSDYGSGVSVTGGYSCSSHAVPARWQICLYQGGVLIDCNAGNRFANSGTFSTSCASISSVDGLFQGWMWVQDDTGQSRSVWSAAVYRDKCR